MNVLKQMEFLNQKSFSIVIQRTWGWSSEQGIDVVQYRRNLLPVSFGVIWGHHHHPTVVALWNAVLGLPPLELHQRRRRRVTKLVNLLLGNITWKQFICNLLKFTSLKTRIPNLKYVLQLGYLLLLVGSRIVPRRFDCAHLQCKRSHMYCS